MAEVFLQKDGTPADERTSAHHRVAIEALVEKLTPFEKRYYDAPPDLNPAHGPAAARDPFRHVVVRIHNLDTNDVFPDEGWYHIPHLTPEDCRALFGFDA